MVVVLVGVVVGTGALKGVVQPTNMLVITTSNMADEKRRNPIADPGINIDRINSCRTELIITKKFSRCKK
ncbi:MAG: hypothetical protein NMNS02_01980 [Nitrosomonas sp.]|nr:MAG: hypothetical protein NMNS02_01980 [Nitrosomonas sp.]